MRRRAVIHFFVLGALLLGARAVIARLVPHGRPVVEVVLPEGLDEAATRRRIDEAIMVEEGLRFGWATTDPIIRRRLAMNMSFAAGTPSPVTDAIAPEVIEEALALGMDRSDPVVRGRLVYRLERVLAAVGPEEQPDDATLRAHLEAHRARFERPERVTLVHVLLRHEGHADPEAEAAALLERLRREGVSVDAAPRLGDTIPLLPPRQRSSIINLDRTFGGGFGEAVASAPVGEWSGPYASSFGVHLVFVEAREASRLPPLEAIRGRVLADYQDEQSRVRIARRLAELRDRYEVRIVRAPEAS
jgi:hypothetical protein